MRINSVVPIICLLLTGSAFAVSPPCSPVFEDDFESGDWWWYRWASHYICWYESFSFQVVLSGVDDSYVLLHMGGYGEVYVPGLVVENCSIEADIRNVAVYDGPTAKVMGLALRIDESSGEQYICWLTAAGDLYLYRAVEWTTCPPIIAHTLVDSIAEGTEFHMSFSVLTDAYGDSLCVRLNGELVLGHRESIPLPGGTAGMLAGAGTTYFDNVSIFECTEPSAADSKSFGVIKALFR